jgi:hypothetical protein
MRRYATSTVLASTLLATVVLPASAGPSLTIYNENLALIRDQRSITLPAGEGRIEFPGVSAQIRPETAVLVADGVTVFEQNFDFDLLTPEKLIEKAVGQEITLVRINPATGREVTERAKVLSAVGGAVLKIGERIEVLRGDGMPTRVIFDTVPANLRPQPTLSMLVDGGRGGARPVQLSYLSGGLSWRADYVAQWDEAKGRMALQGWITLTNNSGTAFENARTQLVAGDINQVRPQFDQQMMRAEMVVTAAAAAPKVSQEAVADYHMYTLPRPTTIANNQTKQVAFLSAQSVAAIKVYRFDAPGFQTYQKAANVPVRIEFDNSEKAGLGMPLPRGTIRVYGQDRSGDNQFLGEDAIDHTAEGSDVALQIGNAFDVTVLPVMTANRIIAKTESSQTIDTSMRYTLRNAKDTPVTVQVRQDGLWGDWAITAQSQDGQKVSAQVNRWDVKVPAKGSAVLTFTVRTRN